MIAVIFEVSLRDGRGDRYLELASQLGPLLEQIDGFVSIERFRSLADPDKLLSLSFWRDEESVARWRQLEAHRGAQQEGRAQVFADYRLRVASVLRDYGMRNRTQAPVDSRRIHDAGAD
jgi:heme-degrading monooxygenase HmoA